MSILTDSYYAGSAMMPRRSFTFWQTLRFLLIAALNKSKPSPGLRSSSATQ